MFVASLAEKEASWPTSPPVGTLKPGNVANKTVPRALN